MKKLLLLGTLVASLSNATVFAQGSFSFNTSARWAWDNVGGAPTNPGVSNKLKVAFLLGSGPALISSFGLRVPTNASALGFDIDWDAAWNALLNDPNYKFATNSTTGQMIVASTTTLGGVSLPGSTFVQGTSASGGTIRMIMVGWDSQYSNPWSASSVYLPSIGWSAPLDYNYVGTAGTPTAINIQDPAGVTKFGVWAFVPEPSSVTLAVVGGAAMWIRRRRAIA